MRKLLFYVRWLVYCNLNGGNVKTLTPGDPELHSNKPPHETAAVLRMHRAGRSGPEIMKILGYNRNSPRLMNELQQAMDQEQAAHAAGAKIHDAIIPIVGR